MVTGLNKFDYVRLIIFRVIFMLKQIILKNIQKCFQPHFFGAAVFNILANATKVYYTYDKLDCVTTGTVRRICDNSVISNEDFTYDAAGDITDAPGSCYRYGTNNRIVVYRGHSLSYDLDGNMLTSDKLSFSYDSANRLIKAG